ncbi:MAG: CDP-alcohol phosphatidyltransferase family protein, partial [Sedimenticolaceae bacterium]
TKTTPNVVTTASLVFTILFFPLVLNGYFLAGVGCIWAMALLDTVDGKLARVTLTSTQFGRVYDHGIDLVAPPLWWLAWWLGLPEHGDGLIYWSVWMVVGGHVAGKLVEQLFISTFGIKIHIWRRFDSNFRLITARRNPNLLILTLFTVLGFPAAGYLAVAVWILFLFSLGVHMVRYLQALAARRNGVAITSWLAA